jgi:hypothetical protein
MWEKFPPYSYPKIRLMSPSSISYTDQETIRLAVSWKATQKTIWEVNWNRKTKQRPFVDTQHKSQDICT